MPPRVVIHNAVSLDGHTVGFAPNLELFYRLAGTWQEDLTLAGSETILAAAKLAGDAPAEGGGVTAESQASGRLAVVDSRGRVKDWGFLKRSRFWDSFVALCSHTTPKHHLEAMRAQGVETLVAGDDRVDLREAIELLVARYGVSKIRVESGGVLNSVLLQADVVTEVSLLVHPVIVGRPERTWVMDATGSRELELVETQALEGQYVWLRYLLVDGAAGGGARA